jgi:hypothetical protein
MRVPLATEQQGFSKRFGFRHIAIESTRCQEHTHANRFNIYACCTAGSNCGSANAFLRFPDACWLPMLRRPKVTIHTASEQARFKAL